MKVLIVDDEIMIRIALKSVINWESYGYTIIGETSDGKKALEFIRKFKPDIVITDIKMPVMDGIELIRQATNLPNPPKIIVLSSYNDFQLVKEAMRLGAVDYLLKLELSSDSILKALDDLRKQVTTEEDENENYQIQRYIRKNIHVLEEKFFKDIFNFHMSEEEFRQSIKLIDITLDFDRICCMLIKTSNQYVTERYNEKDLELFNYSILNITEEILNDVFHGYCFELKPNEYFLVFSNEREIDEQVSSIVEVAETIAEMLKKYLSIEVMIGFGSWGKGIQGIKNSYHEARKALEYGVVSSHNNVVSWEETGVIPSNNFHYSLLSIKDKLFETIEFCQEDLLVQLLQTILNDLSRLALTLDNQVNVCLELNYMLAEVFAKNNINTATILTTSLRTSQQLINLASFSQVIDWINQIKQDLLEYMNLTSNKGHSKIIVKAKKYITDYYDRELSLKEVANAVHLSPFYLSNLFVQHGGISFTEYMTKVRIDKGKELLKQTDYRIYEISEMIGYQNITYFNRIFKKVTGMTPVEYRNKAY